MEVLSLGQMHCDPMGIIGLILLAIKSFSNIRALCVMSNGFHDSNLFMGRTYSLIIKYFVLDLKFRER